MTPAQVREMPTEDFCDLLGAMPVLRAEEEMQALRVERYTILTPEARAQARFRLRAVLIGQEAADEMLGEELHDIAHARAEANHGS